MTRSWTSELKTVFHSRQSSAVHGLRSMQMTIIEYPRWEVICCQITFMSLKVNRGSLRKTAFAIAQTILDWRAAMKNDREVEVKTGRNSSWKVVQDQCHHLQYIPIQSPVELVDKKMTPDRRIYTSISTVISKQPRVNWDICFKWSSSKTIQAVKWVYLLLTFKEIIVDRLQTWLIRVG